MSESVDSTPPEAAPASPPVAPTGTEAGPTTAGGDARPNCGYRLDLWKGVPRWSKGMLARRFIWEIMVRPFFMLLPRPCNWLRVLLLRLMGAKLGKTCIIGPRVKVLMPWNLTLGSFVALGPDVEVYNYAPVSIGDMSVVSQYTYLCTGTHDYTHPHMPLIWKPIAIGSECWIAADVFVAPGVSIGNGAVIGARSVVTSNMPEWTVCAGHPCRPLKPRVLREV